MTEEGKCTKIKIPLAPKDGYEDGFAFYEPDLIDEKSDPGNLSDNGKRFAFTSFEWDNKKGNILEPTVSQDLQYICWQQEMTRSGRAHIQGYVELNTTKGRTIKHVRQLIGMNKCHMELARYDGIINKRYCSKPSGIAGTFKEYGTMKTGQGYRGDIKEMRKDAAAKFGEGKTKIQVAEEMGLARFQANRNVINDIYKQGCKDKAMKAEYSVKIKMLTEKSGTYYMKKIYKKYGKENVYNIENKLNDKKFWNGYEGQAICVITNELFMDKESDKWRILMEKGFPIVIPIKGGEIYFCSEKLFVVPDIVEGKDDKVEADKKKKAKQEAEYQQATNNYSYSIYK